MKWTCGITLIEVLIVIAIIAVMGTATTPFLSRLVLVNNTDTTVDKVIGTLRKAQQYSLDGKDNTLWGTCVTGSVIRLFKGSCTSPTFSEDFSIPGSITISGFSTITFSLLRGEPSVPLTITISSAIGTKTVILNAAGGMDSN